MSRVLRQGANLKIKTRWISHEEWNTLPKERWEELVQSADQILSAIQDKTRVSKHFKLRANECRGVIEGSGPPQCIPVCVLKAYHSYLAAAVQKEQALTPLIGRGSDPDCREMVQHSFKGPAQARTQASTGSERVVTTVKREDASTLEGYDPLRRHLMSGFEDVCPPTQRVNYDARRITTMRRVDDFIRAAPQNAYTLTAGHAGLLAARRLDKLRVNFTSQPRQTEFCDMWLVGSGNEDAEDDEEVVSVVWFIYLAHGKEQALVWVLNEEFTLQTSKIEKITAVRVHEKSTGAPLFTLRQVGGIIRDSPPSADNERVCQVCRTHRTAGTETVCLLCQHGLIVGKVQYKERDAGRYTLRDAELHNPTGYMIEVQSRVNPREWVRFDIDTTMPMFSHGEEVSKAYGDALIQLWGNGCQDLDSDTQWRQKRGIALLTQVLNKPDELEKDYRAPNDGLANGASRCWANTLLQMLGLSAKLREKLQASTSLKVVNLLKVLELLQSYEGPLSRVERSKQTNAAAEAFYASMGGIFANKRHNCLHEGYCTLLSMLSDECPDAYNLFMGVMECRSVCQTCHTPRVWEQILTLPTLAAPKNQEQELDFEDMLKNNMVASKDTAQNTCESCKDKTLFDVTYTVKVLPVVTIVGIHRKYHVAQGKKSVAKKSTARAVNAKKAFTLNDQYGDVMVIPRAWGVHHGPKPTEGHYVAYGAKGRSMVTCFNDSKVSQVDLADVDEALISHVLLEFTRDSEESAKASRKRTHEAANLKRAAIHLKKLKVEKLMNPGDGVISQIVGGMSITVGPKTKAAECS